MKRIHRVGKGRILISITGTSERLEIWKRDSYFSAVTEAKGSHDGRFIQKQICSSIIVTLLNCLSSSFISQGLGEAGKSRCSTLDQLVINTKLLE